MIRRCGLTIFFLLALLLAAGAWVGSYWRDVGGRHYSVRTGAQAIFVVCGSMYAFAGGNGWPTETWHYLYGAANPSEAAWHEELYRAARYHLLGFAFDPAEKFWGAPDRMLIIPLWFPTLLSALGLLWAWRRKRRRDVTLRRGFEVQRSAPQT